jgi:TctA family transporter
MDVTAALLLGLQTALSPENLLYCFVGVFFGTFIGVLPGIGALAAISMLLPVSFYLPPTTALVMLAGVYYGAEYGGSIAAILLNIPGTPSASVTCLDGYPLARQGRAGVALFVTAMASFSGGMIGVLMMAFLSPTLASVALSFGPTEYFAVMLLGLIAASVVSSGGALRGVTMVVAGILLGTAGVDVTSGAVRFTLGFPELRDGVSLVVVAMGLFGVSEVIASIRANAGGRAQQVVDYRAFFPRRAEWLRSPGPILRGGGIGAFFGALPGTGQTVAAFVAYALEKKVSRNQSEFGGGAIEGVVAPEAANNAAAQAAFIPTLTIGVPGSSTMALMMGALMIHGITPGPRILTEHPDLFWGLVASFVIGNLLLLVLNIPLIGLWVRLLRIPYRLMYPTIVVLICVGVFSLRNSAFDVWMTLAFGLLGYGMKLCRFEPAPLLIGFVLGPMMEEHLRRAMLLSRGDPMIFVERPISGALLAVSAVLLLWPVVEMISRKRKVARVQPHSF